MTFYEDFGKYKSSKAIVSEEGSITYEELETHAQSMRSQLAPGSLVVHFAENTIGSVCGYVGFLYNKLVPILLNSRIDGAFAERLLDLYRPEYIYVPNRIRDKFPDYAEKYNALGFSVLKTNFQNKHPLHSDLALLMTTSGSTGSPKLVRQSHRNIQSNAESIANYLELDKNEKPLCVLPMNYTYGLSVINSHLLVGATIVLTQRSLFEPELWRLCREEGATSFSGVPYNYEILKKLRFSRMNLPALRTMTQAGGRLSEEMQKEFGQFAKENNKRFFVMYGQTEATARMSYLPHENTLDKPGSIGRAIPGGKFWLLSEDEKVIEKPDAVGELVYGGPNVAMGYAEVAADLAKGDEFRGVLKTGDMAKMDSDGFFFIVGRKKRFLKIFGNRVNLDEMEQLLRGKFPLFDCACVGVDDRMSVFVTSDSAERQAEVKKFISEKSGLHPSGFAVNFVAELPKNEAGKVQYSGLGKK